MNNTINDLNNYLFEQIERLNDDDLAGEELDNQIKKSKAIKAVADTIIDSGKLALAAKKEAREYGDKNAIDARLLEKSDD